MKKGDEKKYLERCIIRDHYLSLDRYLPINCQDSESNRQEHGKPFLKIGVQIYLSAG